LLKDIIYNNLAQGLQFGSRWVLNLVLISIMDIKLYAVFSFIYSLSNILYGMLSFGSGDYLIAASENSKSLIKKLINSIIIVSIFFLVVLMTYAIIVCFYPEKSFALDMGYGIVLGYVLSINLVLFSYFKAIGNFKKELVAYAFFSFLLLGFVAYCKFILQTITDFGFVFEFLIILNILITLFAVFSSDLRYRLLAKQKNIRISYNFFKRNLKLRFYFGLQEIVTALYTQGGLLILFYFLDKETYGYYRALFVMIAPIMMISVAVYQVVLKYLKEDSQNQVILFRSVIKYTMGFAICVVLILGFLKSYIFDFIKIETNTVTVNAFFILLIVVILRFMFFGYEALLVILDRQRERFLITLLGVLFSLISIFMLLPQYGLVGAVSANLVANITVAIGLLILGEYYIGKK